MEFFAYNGYLIVHSVFIFFAFFYIQDRLALA